MAENKIIRAVQLIKADAQLSVNGEDIDSIVWENGETPIAKADIEAKIPEAETAIANEAQAKIDLKASAKAKLIAGEALTEDEANLIVL
tara:strand:- start:395 stop:661 length:267 start_codon:yes stop_codon:yes gene_type:complete